MSLFSLSRWRPHHLLLGWVLYWTVLFAVALGPAVPALLRAMRRAGHGEFSVSVSNTVLSLVIKEMGRTTWTGSVHMLTAALWIAVPPLVLWALWLRARGGALRADEARPVRT